MTKLSGFVNIIKPTGVTSFDVVSKVKKTLGTKKVGHLGTLDPAAAGVLPIAVGKATKFFDYFLTKDKCYTAVVKFGIETDTLDSFGNITNKDNIQVSKEQIKLVLPEFIGEIEQIPPKYSALKVNGKKACDLMRNNVEFELKPRKITIFDIKLEENCDKNIFIFRVHCSAGTYIRTLFSDIAKKLGTCATTVAIIRTKSGKFDLTNAITIEELNSQNQIIPIDVLFKDLKKINVTSSSLSKKLLNGVKVNSIELDIADNYKDNFFIYINNKLLGMYKIVNKQIECIVYLYEE